MLFIYFFLLRHVLLKSLMFSSSIPSGFGNTFSTFVSFVVMGRRKRKEKKIGICFHHLIIYVHTYTHLRIEQRTLSICAWIMWASFSEIILYQQSCAFIDWNETEKDEKMLIKFRVEKKNQLSSRCAIRLQYLVAFVENINFSIRSSGLFVLCELVVYCNNSRLWNQHIILIVLYRMEAELNATPTRRCYVIQFSRLWFCYSTIP